MFSLFAGYCIAFPNEDSKRGHVSGFLAKHFEIRAVNILLAHGRAKYVVVLNFNSRLAIGLRLGNVPSASHSVTCGPISSVETSSDGCQLFPHLFTYLPHASRCRQSFTRRAAALPHQAPRRAAPRGSRHRRKSRRCSAPASRHHPRLSGGGGSRAEEVPRCSLPAPRRHSCLPGERGSGAEEDPRRGTTEELSGTTPSWRRRSSALL
jgi:hypothetical protein